MLLFLLSPQPIREPHLPRRLKHLLLASVGFHAADSSHRAQIKSSREWQAPDCLAEPSRASQLQLAELSAPFKRQQVAGRPQGSPERPANLSTFPLRPRIGPRSWLQFLDHFLPLIKIETETRVARCEIETREPLASDWPPLVDCWLRFLDLLCPSRRLEQLARLVSAPARLIASNSSPGRPTKRHLSWPRSTRRGLQLEERNRDRDCD